MERSADTDEQIKTLKAQIEPLWESYKKKREAYDAAVNALNNLRSLALAGTEPQHVQDWAISAATYRKTVSDALNDWVVDGHKLEVETMLAKIDSMNKRQAN